MPADRRAVLQSFACAVAGSLPGLATAQTPAASSVPPLRVTQLLDGSAGQQELSRDYATGLRLALSENGRSSTPLQLTPITVDGSPASVERALRAVKDDPAQVALLGTVGEQLALSSIATAQRIGLDIAHLAPWLADTRHDAGQQVFPLFASREAQIERTLKSLATMGISALGVVYSTPELAQSLREGMARNTRRLGLDLQEFTAAARVDLSAYGQRFPAASPVLLLFVGGTIELALFTRGLEQCGLSRYVVCLSDVDLTTLMQLPRGKTSSVILSQVLPNAQSSSLPLMRRYRSALKALYDEAPSPLSLAGYVAGRYALQALAGLRGRPGRAEVLAELQRRPAADLDGFSIRFTAGRGSSFVNQTMLLADGKLIG